MPFAPHAYVIVAPPGHPLTKCRHIPLQRLAEEPLIMRERGSDTWLAMREAFGAKFGTLNQAMEIASNETIKQAVIAGMGLAFLSIHALTLERQVGWVSVLDVEGFPAMRSWYVVHRRSKQLPPVAMAFKAFLQEEGADQIGKLTIA